MDQPEKRKLSDPASDGPNPTDKRPRVIGPSLPPPSDAPAAQDDAASNSDAESESSDDDDFGPSLPPPEGSAPPATVAPGPTVPTTEPAASAESAGPATSRRDDWMLQPPDDSSWASRVDPTKLRNRKFQSGKPGSSRPAASGGVDASWTETPEQKMRRLQDEVLGVSTTAAGLGGPRKEGEGGSNSKKAQLMAERIEKFNESRRKEKAAETAAQKDKKKEEDDDPSQRAFDKEKDMALGSKISASQRRDMISKASDFGSRFSKGKFL